MEVTLNKVSLISSCGCVSGGSMQFAIFLVVSMYLVPLEGEVELSEALLQVKLSQLSTVGAPPSPLAHLLLQSSP